MPLPVRWLAAPVLLAVLSFGFSACGSKDAGAGVVVRIASPTPSAGTNVPGNPATATNTPLPPPELVLSTMEVYQAGAVLVSVTGPVTGGSVTFLKRAYPLTKGAQSMYTFVGVDTDDPTGPQPLHVDFTLTNGSRGALDETITVLKTEWTVESLDFTPEVSELLDPQIVNDEAALIHSVYSKVTPEKYWSGGWLLPVDGPITARYGEQRSINGGPVSGHHGGTDIGIDEGTPVKAANAGRVALARELKVHGNMVIIDHGGGLYSGYAHLSRIEVTEGQMVQQGDVIAESGNTGLSTGAHLHWEMAIDGILLDALRFTDGTNGF